MRIPLIFFGLCALVACSKPNAEPSREASADTVTVQDASASSEPPTALAHGAAELQRIEDAQYAHNGPYHEDR